MAKKDNSLDAILQKYGAEKTLEFISSGSLILDKVLGGGIALGGMYAFWGPQGSGKSSIAIQCIKKFCKKGRKCVIIDVEKAFNQSQQEAFGVRQYVEDGTLLYLTADNYSQLDEINTVLAEQSDVKLVVVDSESMLLPAMGKDVDVASERPGQKARQASLCMTKAKSMFYQAGIASIWLFHARANISMGPANPYAPQEKMGGGFSQKHIPDAILKITAGSKLGDKGAPSGQVIHLECEKNKFTAPFQKYDTELYFAKGIDQKKEIIYLAIQQDLIQQKGSFFTLPSGATVRGKESLYDLSNDQLKAIKSNLQF